MSHAIWKNVAILAIYFADIHCMCIVLCPRETTRIIITISILEHSWILMITKLHSLEHLQLVHYAPPNIQFSSLSAHNHYTILHTCWIFFFLPIIMHCTAASPEQAHLHLLLLCLYQFFFFFPLTLLLALPPTRHCSVFYLMSSSSDL